MSLLEVHPRSLGSPEADLGFEETLLARAREGTAGLFLYAWPRPVLVLGRGQGPAGIASDRCARLGIPILRRASGGAAVLHDRTLAVTLALPGRHPWVASIPGLYDRFVGAIGRVLADLGAPVRRGIPRSQNSTHRRSPICFEDVLGESLMLDGRKVVGCAQARRAGAVLVHGAISLGLDAEVQAAAFGVPADRIRASIGAVPLDEAGRRRLPEALVAGFTRALGGPAPASALISEGLSRPACRLARSPADWESAWSLAVEHP